MRHSKQREKNNISNCLICNKEFKHIYKIAKYCCEYCKYLANYKYKKIPIKTSNCVNCNKEFTHKRSNSFYCSAICNSKFNYNKEYKRLMKAKGNYKYKAFNYKPDEHLNINADLAIITKATGLKEKTIVSQLINKERKRLENEQGDHNTITA